MSDEQQASFNGWAKVEVMGHQTHIGFVRTEAYGQAVMFRVDTPELPAREYVLTAPEFCESSPGTSHWTPAGSTVQRIPRPGCTVLIGAGSIYRILPCTEAAALKAIEQNERATIKLISLPEGKALGPGLATDDDENNGETDEPDEGEDDEYIRERA